MTKSLIHECKNSSNDGKVFGFYFVDKARYEIHVTCLNELVDRFYHVIKSNSTYVISNSHIKVTNTKYSSSTNPYKIFLHNSSTISPSTCIDSTIPMHNYHIKIIESLISLPINSLVDVIGILLSISLASTIHKRDDTETIKCTTTIMDKSGCTIDITLWGSHCQITRKQLVDPPLQPNPPIILIKSGWIASWSRKSIDTIFQLPL